MRVLVAYATRHESTAGIAERIGANLAEHGLEVTTTRIQEPIDLEPFDAFVIGSAVQMGHWLGEARHLVEGGVRTLAERPTWLFSSGPIGRDTIDAKGRNVADASRPMEYADYERRIHPRHHQVFFGAFDPEAPAVGVAERLVVPMMRLAARRSGMASGDFRDWDAINAWADGIALALLGDEVPAVAPVAAGA